MKYKPSYAFYITTVLMIQYAIIEVGLINDFYNFAEKINRLEFYSSVAGTDYGMEELNYINNELNIKNFSLSNYGVHSHIENFSRQSQVSKLDKLKLFDKIFDNTPLRDMNSIENLILT